MMEGEGMKRMLLLFTIPLLFCSCETTQPVTSQPYGNIYYVNAYSQPQPDPRINQKGVMTLNAFVNKNGRIW